MHTSSTSGIRTTPSPPSAHKDLARIRHVVAECRAGRPEAAYQLGHPHAFISSTYLGEIDCCVPLVDLEGHLAALKRLARPYPPLLRNALITCFLFEADFSLDGAAKGARRVDVAYVTDACIAPHARSCRCSTP